MKTNEKMELDLRIYDAIVIWKSDNIPSDLSDWLRISEIRMDDSDWVAIIPPIFKDEYIPWLEQPTFGCCNVGEHDLNSEGYRIVIGYHT